MVQSIRLHKEILAFVSMDYILKCDHSPEQELFLWSVSYDVQGFSDFDTMYGVWNSN